MKLINIVKHLHNNSNLLYWIPLFIYLIFLVILNAKHNTDLPVAKTWQTFSSSFSFYCKSIAMMRTCFTDKITTHELDYKRLVTFNVVHIRTRNKELMKIIIFRSTVDGNHELLIYIFVCSRDYFKLNYILMHQNYQ